MKGTRYCTVLYCGQPHYARGYCKRHYSEWLRYDRDRPCCQIGGCDNAAITRGWCSMHYQRWRTHSDPTFVRPVHRRGCSILGCDREHNGHGYCAMHRTRWRKHGDPLIAVHGYTFGPFPTPADQLPTRNPITLAEQAAWHVEVERIVAVNMRTRRELGEWDCRPDDDYSYFVTRWQAGLLDDPGLMAAVAAPRGASIAAD